MARTQVAVGKVAPIGQLCAFIEAQRIISPGKTLEGQVILPTQVAFDEMEVPEAVEEILQQLFDTVQDKVGFSPFVKHISVDQLIYFLGYDRKMVGVERDS
jgi:hypothetical protein